MRDSLHRLTVILIVLLAAGCVAAPVREAAMPVSENSAVLALVEAAHKDREADKLVTAGASLERALRIEPRNPMLWNELALLRMQQGHYTQAISLAAKSNAWAGEKRVIRAANWRIIGNARARLGDEEGARVAYERARQEEH